MNTSFFKTTHRVVLKRQSLLDGVAITLPSQGRKACYRHSCLLFVFRLSMLGCGDSPLVGSSGLEPPTSRLSGARSNHLSYEPIQFLSVYLVSLASLSNFVGLVEMMGFEPMTPCLQGRCSPS